jgi:hypothetical protein
MRGQGCGAWVWAGAGVGVAAGTWSKGTTTHSLVLVQVGIQEDDMR